jgi:hypothetical protein
VCRRRWMPRALPLAAEPTSTEDSMHTVTSADGTRIAYDRYGEGPAVILVGGAMGYRKFKKFE